MSSKKSSKRKLKLTLKAHKGLRCVLMQWRLSVSRWRCFIFNTSREWSWKLTDSGPQCVLLPRRTPPATYPPVEWAWGRSVWTWACLCTWANPGTGTAAPSGSRPEARGGGKDNGYPRLIHICRGEGVNRCCIKMQSDCKDAARVKLSFIRGWIEMVKGRKESLKR